NRHGEIVEHVGRQRPAVNQNDRASPPPVLQVQPHVVAGWQMTHRRLLMNAAAGRHAAPPGSAAAPLPYPSRPRAAVARSSCRSCRAGVQTAGRRSYHHRHTTIRLGGHRRPNARQETTVQARFVFHLLLIGAFAAPAALFPSHLIAQSADRAAQLIGELDVPEADTPVREHPGWRPPVRVLVGGGGATPERLAELQAVAPGVEIVPIRPGQAAQETVGTADALIGTCHPALLEAGTSLRWVQAFGAGVEDCLASPFIRERGILLTNVQRVLAPAMAEHVMALALSLARQLPAYR